jgi:type VI secretion system protein ImpB
LTSHELNIPTRARDWSTFFSQGEIHMAESLQHKLDRVRRPRVHITYDVETGGALKKVELPFVVGVLADLSGQPKEPLKPLKERKAVYIDRDNFNDVMARAGARLAIKVPNMLTDPNSKLAVELNFKNIDDFEPARVAEQIGPLKQLLEMRQELTQLLSRMEGNDKLGQLLESILTNQEKAAALDKFMEQQAPKGNAAAPPPTSRSAPPPPAAKPAPPPPPPAAKPTPPPPPPVAAAPAPPPPPAAPEEAPAGSGEADLDDLLKQMES